MLPVYNNLARVPIRLGLLLFGVHRVISASDPVGPLLEAFCASDAADGPEADRRRAAARDMLRNGKFKPTGRSKPASEYLLRTVRDAGPDGFPRINPIVDIANFLSLSQQVPVSLWDTDKARGAGYRFRLGREGESYVFNSAGQSIELHDLVVGCAIGADGTSEQPIVNPVKDSLLTKTDDASLNFGLVIYAPESVFSDAEVANLLEKLSEMLATVAEGLTCEMALPTTVS